MLATRTKGESNILNLHPRQPRHESVWHYPEIFFYINRLYEYKTSRWCQVSGCESEVICGCCSQVTLNDAKIHLTAQRKLPGPPSYFQARNSGYGNQVVPVKTLSDAFLSLTLCCCSILRSPAVYFLSINIMTLVTLYLSRLSHIPTAEDTYSLNSTSSCVEREYVRLLC